MSTTTATAPPTTARSRAYLDGAHAKMVGVADADATGRGMSAAGDVYGDGHADVLVGAPYNDQYSTNAGVAYLVHGPVTGEVSLGDTSVAEGMYGQVNAESTGDLLSPAGDVNGDGYDGDEVLAEDAEPSTSSDDPCWRVTTGEEALTRDLSVETPTAAR